MAKVNLSEELNMSTKTLSLALNLDGSNKDNLKTQTFTITKGLTADQGGVYVMDYGVFLKAGLKVKHVDTGNMLALNVDYYLTYYSKHLKANYDIDGWGGIVLVNKDLTGNLEITSNQVGGGYVRFNPTYVVDIIDLVNGVPEQIFWDNVLDAPSTVHPNEHNLPADNIATGYQDYVSVLWIVAERVRKIAEINAADRIPPATIMETSAAKAFFDGNNYWLYLDGRTIKRSDYPQLFIALGVANGTDTYELPAKPNHIMRSL